MRVWVAYDPASASPESDTSKFNDLFHNPDTSESTVHPGPFDASIAAQPHLRRAGVGAGATVTCTVSVVVRSRPAVEAKDKGAEADERTPADPAAPLVADFIDALTYIA
jgi:hypothetical protein